MRQQRRVPPYRLPDVLDGEPEADQVFDPWRECLFNVEVEQLRREEDDAADALGGHPSAVAEEVDAGTEP